MKRKKTIQPFTYDLGEEDLKRTRHKARALRESQWWKRRLAKGVCHYCGRSTPPQRTDHGSHRTGIPGRQKHQGQCGTLLQGMQHGQKTAAPHGMGAVSGTV